MPGMELLEELAVAVAALFGGTEVPPSLAEGLRALFPSSTLLRASLRCGTGLFVTSDLLAAGPLVLNAASLERSLAGLAMQRQQPYRVELPPSRDPSAPTELLCAPAAAGQAAGAPGTDPFYVGAILVGSRGGLPPAEQAALLSLAAEVGPYLLLLGLGKVQALARALDLVGAGGRLPMDDEEEEEGGEACRERSPPRPARGSEHPAVGLRHRSSRGDPASYAEADGSDDDPKAAAQAAAAAAAAAVPAQGPLLRFLSQQDERRYLQAAAVTEAGADAVCLGLYILCFALMAAADCHGVLCRGVGVALLAALAAPLVAMSASFRWYVRRREALLLPLLLLLLLGHGLGWLQHLPGCAATSSSSLLGWAASLGASETVLLFPISNKVRFSIFLPVQLAKAACIAGSVSWISECAPQLSGLGCAGAVLALAGGAAGPLLISYLAEAKSRAGSSGRTA